MTISRGSVLGLVLAAGALGAQRPVVPSLEAQVRESRAAYFSGEFERSAQLAMEVILDKPDHQEARELLRASAKVLAGRDIEHVQAERARLIQDISDARAARQDERRQEQALRDKEDQELAQRLDIAERDRPLWSSQVRAALVRGDLLQAYEVVFQIQELFPKDPWLGTQLERLQLTSQRDRAKLDARSTQYREALSGYEAAAAGRPAEALLQWRASLRRSPDDAAYPRRLIDRRLAQTVAKTAPPAPPRKPRKAVAPPAPEPTEWSWGGWSGESPRKAVAPPAPQPAPAAKPAPRRPPARAPPPNPRDIEDLYIGGLVQYGYGNVEEAVRIWEQVLRLDPTHVAAGRALKRARHDLEGKR